jgi:hypothetical protein
MRQRMLKLSLCSVPYEEPPYRLILRHEAAESVQLIRFTTRRSITYAYNHIQLKTITKDHNFELTKLLLDTRDF